MYDFHYEQDPPRYFKDITIEEKTAAIWFMRSLDFLDLMDSGRKMTDEETEYWLNRATEDGDHILRLLVYYKRKKDHERV